MSTINSENYFIKNGKPYFLISGEIHYFRLNPSIWKKHLRLLKQTGSNTVSTYIPWDWHEIEEGVFDFEGKTNPSRNLIRFIELCIKEKLEIIVKPGPYILAEYKNQGLPQWLLNKLSKNAFALDESGNIISSDLVSYLSDEFISYVFKWFDRILPIISSYQITNNGPISMIQICNEIGVFQWLSGKIDYNPKVIKLFKQYLTEKYKNIENLNSTYSANYTDFNQIDAPKGRIENKSQYAAYYDFHLFFRKYFDLYIQKLKEKIGTHNIQIQLTHNIPGWIFGNASELPMLISTYSEIIKNNPDIMLGLDHIPEFVSYRNAHSGLACDKILKAVQPDYPVWAAEFQTGTREHHVKAYSSELETFYFASLAYGVKGFNYYMFSQGIHPDGKGFYGKTFYYQTAVNFKGRIGQLYNSIRKVNEFLRKYETDFVKSRTKSEIAVGFYKPYFFTELITSQMLKEIRLDVKKLGLYLDPRFIREEIFFNGLLRALQTLNYNYDVIDLDNINSLETNSYKQLWVVTTEYMDETTQNYLAEFVLKGGHLIMYPAIPIYDLYLNNCNILARKLNLNFVFSESDHLIDFQNIKDVFTHFRKKLIFTHSVDNALALTKDGSVCGIQKNIGEGVITVLGFSFGYSSDEHLKVYEEILRLDKIRKTFKSSDHELQIIVRLGEKYRYLFVLNYHNEKKYFSYKRKKYLINPFLYKVITERIS